MVHPSPGFEPFPARGEFFRISERVSVDDGGQWIQPDVRKCKNGLPKPWSTCRAASIDGVLQP
jgi:hypothetical protein